MSRRGWQGAGEKADTFFFEHDWKPVPGHPAEVATCDVCGLNRWSDEHMSNAERAQHLRRTAELRRRLVAPLDAEAAARLDLKYGSPAPKMPPLAPAVNGPSPRDVESEAIAQNQTSPAAEGPHPFMAAEFPDDADQPRCRLCGKDEAAHKEFEPEIPIAAAFTQDEKTFLSGLMHDAKTFAQWRTEDRVAPVVGEGQALEPPDTAKAFLTEVNGHTLLTAPANVFTREREKAMHANKHFLWMQGRFVGAEKANRNGAFWKTEDLELGELTVRHGPLNWLHEARHVIGTIADTQLVTRQEAADRDLDQPYIQAASAIWRWVYPDEAWVIEQASDANKLWYSMECISESVTCVGDGGCGATASYGDYLRVEGGTCKHMAERSATRHFKNPTFLGGAVIVPPVRPGWAEANAQVMRQAASLAEHAFEQAGKPDVAAAEWEQLMASVLSYGQTA